MGVRGWEGGRELNISLDFRRVEAALRLLLPAPSTLTMRPK